MMAMTDLADHCLNGACNVSGIAIALGGCIGEVPSAERRNHPAIKVVVGQLSYLLGESLGPTEEALADYRVWRNGGAQ